MATMTKKKPAAKMAKSVKPSTSARPAAKPGRNGSALKPKSVKRVYFFGNGKAEGNAGMKDLLGGKGANLADMTLVPLPGPSGLHHHHRDLRRIQRRRPEAPRRPDGRGPRQHRQGRKGHRQEVRRRRPTRCSSPPAPAPR